MDDRQLLEMKRRILSPHINFVRNTLEEVKDSGNKELIAKWKIMLDCITSNKKMKEEQIFKMDRTIRKVIEDNLKRKAEAKGAINVQTSSSSHQPNRDPRLNRFRNPSPTRRGSPQNQPHASQYQNNSSAEPYPRNRDPRLQNRRIESPTVSSTSGPEFNNRPGRDIREFDQNSRSRSRGRSRYRSRSKSPDRDRSRGPRDSRRSRSRSRGRSRSNWRQGPKFPHDDRPRSRETSQGFVPNRNREVSRNRDQSFNPERFQNSQERNSPHSSRDSVSNTRVVPENTYGLYERRPIPRIQNRDATSDSAGAQINRSRSMAPASHPPANVVKKRISPIRAPQEARVMPTRRMSTHQSTFNPEPAAKKPMPARRMSVHPCRAEATPAVTATRTVPMRRMSVHHSAMSNEGRKEEPRAQKIVESSEVNVDKLKGALGKISPTKLEKSNSNLIKTLEEELGAGLFLKLKQILAGTSAENVENSKKPENLGVKSPKNGKKVESESKNTEKKTKSSCSSSKSSSEAKPTKDRESETKNQKPSSSETKIEKSPSSEMKNQKSSSSETKKQKSPTLEVRKPGENKRKHDSEKTKETSVPADKNLKQKVSEIQKSEQSELEKILSSPKSAGTKSKSPTKKKKLSAEARLLQEAKMADEVKESAEVKKSAEATKNKMAAESPKPPPKKRQRSELDKLHESINSFYDRDSIILAKGKRSCTQHLELHEKQEGSDSEEPIASVSTNTEAELAELFDLRELSVHIKVSDFSKETFPLMLNSEVARKYPEIQFCTNITKVETPASKDSSPTQKSFVHRGKATKRGKRWSRGFVSKTIKKKPKVKNSESDDEWEDLDKSDSNPKNVISLKDLVNLMDNCDLPESKKEEKSKISEPTSNMTNDNAKFVENVGFSAERAGNLLVCQLCGLQTISIRTFTDHIRLQHLDVKWSQNCSICQKPVEKPRSRSMLGELAHLLESHLRKSSQKVEAVAQKSSEVPMTALDESSKTSPSAGNSNQEPQQPVGLKIRSLPGDKLSKSTEVFILPKPTPEVKTPTPPTPTPIADNEDNPVQMIRVKNADGQEEEFKISTLKVLKMPPGIKLKPISGIGPLTRLARPILQKITNAPVVSVNSNPPLIPPQPVVLQQPNIVRRPAMKIAPKPPAPEIKSEAKFPPWLVKRVTSATAPPLIMSPQTLLLTNVLNQSNPQPTQFSLQSLPTTSHQQIILTPVSQPPKIVEKPNDELLVTKPVESWKSDPVMKSVQPYLSNPVMKWGPACDKMLNNSFRMAALYKCMGTYCTFATSDEKVFSAHLKVHNDEEQDPLKSYKCCAYCGHKSNKSSQLGSHISYTHGCDRFQCSLCFFRAFADFYVYEDHYKNFHKSSSSSRTILEVEPLYKHMSKQMYCTIARNITMNVTPLACALCGKGFFVQEFFKQHMMTHEQFEVKRRCTKCHENVDRDTNAYHLLVCYGLGFYHCVYCQFGTDNFSILSAHLAAQHPSRMPIFCERTHSSSVADKTVDVTSADFLTRKEISKTAASCVRIKIMNDENTRNVENVNKIVDLDVVSTSLGKPRVPSPPEKAEQDSVEQFQVISSDEDEAPKEPDTDPLKPKSSFVIENVFSLHSQRSKSSGLRDLLQENVQ